jgi:hypothetical protein
MSSPRTKLQKLHFYGAHTQKQINANLIFLWQNSKSSNGAGEPMDGDG